MSGCGCVSVLCEYVCKGSVVEQNLIFNTLIAILIHSSIDRLFAFLTH